jgi:hypothetical protein
VKNKIVNMVTKFDEYIKEGFFTNLGIKSDNFLEKISTLVELPVIKYIERKTKDLTDEEKLMVIAKISNNIDKIFSPFNSFMVLMGIIPYSLIGLDCAKVININNQQVYLALIAGLSYNSLSKKYRLKAKESYQKIRAVIADKYKKEISEDPYGEESWGDNVMISKADEIRYDKGKRHKFWLEEFPIFGLGHKRDIDPR